MANLAMLKEPSVLSTFGLLVIGVNQLWAVPSLIVTVGVIALVAGSAIFLKRKIF